jgi:hypothetical protein
MNGDLGNLLTGEMGEAASRFAYDDFAEAYGRRVAGRVRRRRAVRAAGVGGGTMLTAGALVVGATHMPWGALGAAPGVGGSDCVTESPLDSVLIVTGLFGGGDERPDEIVVTDPTTGGVRMTGVAKADGTWGFWDVAGNPVEATPGPDGVYVVRMSGASADVVMSMPSDGWWPSDPPAAGSFEYDVLVPEGDAAPSASDDCYTPSPTPSPTPSVAPSPSHDPVLITELRGYLRAKDVASPFQCGFTFPTESGGTDGLAITARTASADEVRAEFERRFGNEPLTTYAGDAAGVWATASGMPLTASVYRKGLSVLDPLGTAGFNNVLEGVPGAAQVVAHGMSFVGVRDGMVVATVAPAKDGTAPGVALAPDGAPDSVVLPGSDGAAPGMVLENFLGSDPSAFLLDRSVLTACDSNAGNLDSLSIYAIAGYAPEFSSAEAHMTYAWTVVPTP